jgi:ATP-dependent DNA helicase Rep
VRGSQEWRDFAVLYRANHQARMFEKALRKANIPYKVSGGQSFFDRAEIKDLCAWFRLWVNNDDDPAFLRAITTPKRGIGHTTLQNLGVFASKYKLSLFEALFSSSLGGAAGQGGGQPARVWPLCERPGVPRAPHQRRRGRPRLPADWLKDIDYEKHLYDGEDSEKLAAAAGPTCWSFATGWRARCGGRSTTRRRDPGHAKRRACWKWRRPSALLSTISERETGPERRDAVHPARRQGAGVAACDAGGRDRGHAAVQAGR